MFNRCRFISALLLIVCFVSTAAVGKARYKVGAISDDIVTYTLFDEFSKEFDVEIEYVQFHNFDKAIKAVREGDIDFLANVAYSEERHQWLEYSVPTNIDYTFMHSLNGSNEIVDGSILGIPRATIYPELMKDKFPNIRYVEIEHLKQVRELINEGKIDGVLGSIYRVKDMSRWGMPTYLVDNDETTYPVAVVATKGHHKELLKIIGYFATSPKMVKLIRQKTHEYAYSLSKEALQLDVVNKGINLNKPILINLKSMDQFVIYNTDGTVNGIAADILFQACHILQLNCQLVSDKEDPCNYLFENIQNQTVDIIGPLVITEKRKQQYAFSSPYYNAQGIFVKRVNYKDDSYTSISEMFMERIGVIQGDFLESYMRSMFPGKRIYTYDTLEDMMVALEDSEIDYSFLMRSTFYNFIRASSGNSQIVEDHDVGVVLPYEVGFGFQNNQQGFVLANLFSHAINLIDKEAVIQKYDTPPDWFGSIKLQKELRHRSITALIGLAIFLVIASAFSYKKSITDELTGLKNRRALYRRHGRSFSHSNMLVYLDVNKFKFINDNYGHLIGDKVLQTLANNVKKHWPGQAYRIGGDEFILICKDKGEQIDELLNVIREFSFSDRESGLEHKVTLSIGIARNLDKSYSLDEVLHIADQSMYEAKSKSRIRARNR